MPVNDHSSKPGISLLTELGLVHPEDVEQRSGQSQLTPTEQVLVASYQSGEMDERTWSEHVQQHPALKAYHRKISRG
jgi:hypothetical protein